MATKVIRATLTVAAAIVAATLVVAVPVLGIASPAQAHNYLVSSSPVAGETLTELPDQFQVTTNESLFVVDDATGSFAFQIRDAAGAYYGDGCVAISGPTMTMDAAIGPAGAYTALWQVVSADGHTVTGEIPFTWAPASEVDISEGVTAPPVCGATAPSASAEPDATATSTPIPDASETPVAVDTPASNAVPLSDVLWIGGALAAVGIAVAVAIIVIGRRNKPKP